MQHKDFCLAMAQDCRKHALGLRRLNPALAEMYSVAFGIWERLARDAARR